MKKIILTTATILITFFTRSQNVNSNETKDSLSVSIGSKKVLTKEQLKKEIVSMGIKFPEIVYKQAIYESYHFKSKIFKHNKNLFGMRLAKSRKTTAKNKTKYKYAVYESWFDSLKDYKLWQDNVKPIHTKTLSNYLKYLDKIYSETNNYTAKLKYVH